MPKWHDTEAHEISDTIQLISNYLLTKNIGVISNKTLESWRAPEGLCDKIKTMNNAVLAHQFGVNDSGAGAPDKLRPLLSDFFTALVFYAHREKALMQTPLAQDLIQRLQAFEDFDMWKHLSNVGPAHEIRNHINAAPRIGVKNPIYHADAPIDHGNCINFVFNTIAHDWVKINNNMAHTQYTLGGYAEESQDKNHRLSALKNTCTEGFSRASISANVDIKLGLTYGEDSVIISMNAHNFARYGALKRGEIKQKFNKDDGHHVGYAEINPSYVCVI